MNTIHVVREAGGLGDVLRIFAVLDGLRRKHPETPIHYHGPEHYEQIVMNGHCWGMSRPGCRYVVTQGHAYRACRGAWLDKRKAGGWKQGDTVIDLYCPAWRHEFDAKGDVTKERTALWCEAADVEVETPCFLPTVEEEKLAKAWLEAQEFYADVPGGLRLIGIHPRSAALVRMWRPSLWRTLDTKFLMKRWGVVWFDDSPDYLRTVLDSIQRLHTAIGLPVGVVAAIIARLNAMVTVDSSLFHLAGAVGTPAVGLFGPTRGDLISSIYPTARFVQAPQQSLRHAAGRDPAVYSCKGACYCFPERGFTGGPCLDGCVNMAAIEPEAVTEKLEEILR